MRRLGRVGGHVLSLCRCCIGPEDVPESVTLGSLGMVGGPHFGPKVVNSDHIFFSGKWKLYFENPPRLFFANKTYSKALVSNPKKQEQVIHYKKKLDEYFFGKK